MGKRKKGITGFIIGVSTLLIVLFNIQANMHTFAAAKSIFISTSPDNLLFAVDNMKPGDWSERSLTIQNRGDSDFYYNTEVTLLSGSEKLYKEFLLEIKDGNVLLYEGKINEFTGIVPRHLKARHEEKLDFTIRFPTHLGNEFQGLEFQSEFLFFAEGQEGLQPEQPRNPESDRQKPIRPGEEIKEDTILPSTATNTYNFLIIGIIAVILGSMIYMYRRKEKEKKTSHL
ncbi:LPXTG cell wall anchor domain-containing protein [Alkalihalobacillus sp. LMS39]|uniref:LPXTG cell wall anchor domain-containing protein n=1 Tax=Alkalihalobacillus sp. LMS39 TaxID=2924032 RepID=UPI001FB3DE96|nr:LPXTG cell wall anchor domain-containing protein [Alkalihalobacillus sp. LMS39]UOE94851.1 LPXTG cell wall anchor domain-containing protein [Alkalihalobacillus sp. LMS39]